jgi:hypothetical protein
LTDEHGDDEIDFVQFHVTSLWVTTSCPFSSVSTIGSHQQESDSM